MKIVELKDWLYKVKDLSIDELLTVQEKVNQELKLKTLNSQNKDVGAKFGNEVQGEASAFSIAALSSSDLSPELEEELAAMNSFSDKALWKTARSHLSAKEAQTLRQLNHKQQKHGQKSLTQLERQTLEDLGYQYDRSILLRSQAILLLKERGHDTTKILGKS
jgi:Skp family chaperone for outer membrane proteins